ncbi:hypothetical protein BDW02DRAFT_379740 [Decorospora gaudefroyi]|uniref:C2H2-type domain-containing protein n=1 Tax=Decorospora gaudefroyi TaxID=184978 RepID=A0A6A5KDI8_9PLEO|nr:hypothetical protein BDW02DRAFT_379740 [Decorospora gaudefroyi]
MRTLPTQHATQSSSNTTTMASLAHETPSDFQRSTSSATYTNGQQEFNPALTQRTQSPQAHSNNRSATGHVPQPGLNQLPGLQDQATLFHRQHQYQNGPTNYHAVTSHPNLAPGVSNYGSSPEQLIYWSQQASPMDTAELSTATTPQLAQMDTSPSSSNTNGKIGEVHRTSRPGFEYKCDNCVQTFTRVQDLNRHHNGAHDLEPTVHYCPITGCNRGRPFDRHDKMIDHVRKVHPGQV